MKFLPLRAEGSARPGKDPSMVGLANQSRAPIARFGNPARTNTGFAEYLHLLHT